jgi:hypothetical protein
VVGVIFCVVRAHVDITTDAVAIYVVLCVVRAIILPRVDISTLDSTRTTAHIANTMLVTKSSISLGRSVVATSKETAAAVIAWIVVAFIEPA